MDKLHFFRNWLHFLAGSSSQDENHTLYDLPESQEFQHAVWKDAGKKSLSPERKQSIYQNTLNQVSPGIRIIRQQRLLKIAAAVVILLGLGAIIRYAGVFTADGDALIEVVCERGVRKTVVLPDGSAVILTGESKISYPEEFSRENRNVVMNGMAFFDVVKDSDRPFNVSSSGLNITVLGTSFSVEDFQDEAYAKTTLLEGKVCVSPKSNNVHPNPAILHPGEQYNYSRNNNSTSVSQVDAQRVTGWINGRLAIDQLTVEQLCRILERWYDVDFHLPEEIPGNDTFTFTVEGNSIEDVLLLMQKISPMSCRIIGNDIFIEYKN